MSEFPLSRRSVLAGATLLRPGLAMAEAVAAGTPPDHDRRVQWWHEAKFGMFIHWGLYSVIGRHEWVMENEGIPVAEYEQLAKQLQSQTERRARLGQARQARRPEVHGDDHQASRGLLPLRFRS